MYSTKFSQSCSLCSRCWSTRYGFIREEGSGPVARSNIRPMGTVISIVLLTRVDQSGFTLELANQLRIEDIVASRSRNQMRCVPLGPLSGWEASSSLKTVALGT